MKKSFVPFELERMLCLWENTVEYDLSESGVHPITLGELVAYDPEILGSLLQTKLNYAQTNGIPALRERIATLYSPADLDNVIVTVGCAEANYLAMHTVVSPGDEIAIMLPNYMQVWGIANNIGMRVKTFHLKEENHWALDIDELSSVVGPDTRLIAICNPDNPTGYIMTEDEMNAVVRIAERVGAWILADEVYSGTERLTDRQTPSFYGRYEKVLVTNSLSKAYGLPGLRIGWAVGPEKTIEEMWARHDYTTIATTMLGNHLAEFALRPEIRMRLIQRARGLVRGGLPILEKWLDEHKGMFNLIPPQAAPIAFVRYHFKINATRLVERLRKEKSVLLVPGDHFGMDGYLRFRYGLPPDYLREGLRRTGELIGELF